MIQIGTLRTWVQKDGTTSKPYFKNIKGLTYKSLHELLNNIENDLPKFLGKKERYNLFYTVGHHLEGQRKRTSWQCQDIIPFDLDGIDLDRIAEYPTLVAEVCGFDLSKTSIIYSGNGCHILVQVPLIRYEGASDFVKDAKLGYKQLLNRVKEACDTKGLSFDIDTTALDYARILRVPFTVNKKVKKQVDGSLLEITKECILIQNNLEEQNWDIPQVEKKEAAKSLKAGSFPKPDHKTVTEECEFFKWLKDSPNEVHEPHAYAMLSVAGHFDDSHARAISLYSNFSSPSISSKPFEEFMEQALSSSGPRTCQGIDDVWGKCSECKHYKKITSPIMLKSRDHIGTEFMGFTTMSIKGNARVRHYDDLRKWYKRDTDYITISGRRATVMEFNGKYFEEVTDTYIKGVAQSKFLPVVEDDRVRQQFVSQVKADNASIKPESFLHTRKENLINLSNGILDISKGTLKEHSPEYGFTASMDYDYDPLAKCPNWDKFIGAAMREDAELINLIEELLAFCLSGMSYDRFQYYFLLIGEGFNGKSTFISLLQKMLGAGNCTAYPLEDLIKNQDARAELATSLANLVADSSATALKGKDITRLKSWTGNDAVMGRALYKDAISFINRSKFIFGFNDYPEIKTTSKGDDRRIKAIPFAADFGGVDKGFFIKDLGNKLKSERSGILNKVVTAHKRLVTDGFSHSDKLDAMKRNIRKNADSIYDFLTDKLEYRPGAKVFLSEIYVAYSEDNNYGSTNFKKEKRGFNKEVRGAVKNIFGENDVRCKMLRVGAETKEGLVNAAFTKNKEF